MKYLKEGLDYEFLDDIKIYPTTPVKLLTGVYKGVIVCFGKIRIVETEENGDGILGFTFMIVSPENQYEHLKTDQDFKNYLGNILDSIIVDANETPLGLPGPDNEEYIQNLLNNINKNEVKFEDREDYTEELDNRSRIWEESNTVFKE